MAVDLHLKDITKTFIKDGVKFDAVERVDLEVKGGELVTFLGPSGCGKTTTLRMVAGFETPSSGRILIDGEDVTDVMVNKREIGFVFQNYALFPHMTIGDNVGYGLRMRSENSADIARKVGEALEMVGLKGAERRYPNQLSGGEQQRVAVARALAHGPKLVIADEPTGNIDPELSLEMMELLERVSEMGITVVVVTHEHELVRQFHQRVVTLKKGRIISDVPADKEAIRERAEHRERLFETELGPENTAEKEAATV